VVVTRWGRVFQGILLFSSCLERNVPDMFSLWSDIFNRWDRNVEQLSKSFSSGCVYAKLTTPPLPPPSSPHFDDEERLRVLVMMSAQELANGISSSGHVYAMTRAGRSLTPAGALQETFGGMEQVREATPTGRR